MFMSKRLQINYSFVGAGLAGVFLLSFLYFVSQLYLWSVAADATFDPGESTCFYSKLRGDRSGSAVHDMLFALAFSLENNITYKGAFKGRVSNDLAKKDYSLIEILGLQNHLVMLDAEPRECVFVDPKVYRREEQLRLHHAAILRMHNNHLSPFPRPTLVLHHRAGDVNGDSGVGDYSRFTPEGLCLKKIIGYGCLAARGGRRNASEGNLLAAQQRTNSFGALPCWESAASTGNFLAAQFDTMHGGSPDGRNEGVHASSTIDVIIHSEVLPSDGPLFQAALQQNWTVKLKASLPETYSDMLRADVLVIGKSSFSYVPALLNPNTVVYQPFWHQPMPEWVIHRETEPIPPLDSFSMVSSSVASKCTGGEWGKSKPERYVCVINKETTVMFKHLAHGSQTLLPCWSWFRASGAQECSFLLQAGMVLPKWHLGLVEAMGCSVVKKSHPCTVEGQLTRDLRVGWGQAFRWFDAVAHASLLQQQVMHHCAVRSSFRVFAESQNQNSKSVRVMFVQRKSNRKLVITHNTNRNGFWIQQAEQLPNVHQVKEVFMENMLFCDQVNAWAESGVVVAAHGNAVTNSVFIRKCTVVLQIFPLNYYPVGFFGALISNSSGIPLVWWPGSPTSQLNFSAQMEYGAKMQPLVGSTLQDRSRARSRNIDVPVTDLLELLQTALKLHLRCLEDTQNR